VAAPARPFLDRPLARGLAGLVFLACLAGLAWLERERLFPPEGALAAADDPAAACFAGRVAEIDGMLAEGLIEAPQAELFKTRAEAMCRATVGGVAPGPSLPAN
jgi:hypothetical protein